jgi:predicted dinucleotide-binding enzyme
MKIGVLGTGEVGRTLGSGFVKLGHSVTIGSRSPDSPALVEWNAKNGGAAHSGTFAEAATYGELVILATLWTGTENALRLAQPSNLAGKIVIDTTNPLDFSHGFPPSLLIGHSDSAGEQVQRWLPGSHVVKAFNLVGNAHMVHPEFSGGPPDMFIAGNDTKAKETVAALLKDFGWSVIVLGGIENSRILEPAALLWIVTAAKLGSWDLAFKLLRK